ncbi:Uma2 family endonuclease [Algoriphagus halophytocola]|uniref:Uma2 family endonuclease n=1 Tax=Algoriphagus halophytocola TaxID=2991499 RepID=A0ABY6ME21_9BACT|nr:MULTISPECIES: Uma2 family endonuclease [unclassified Algoriphagus]UZD22020.1 Uma2 family endonuclease [Algoriphagus sp. TR-M5]WBL43271.1 Uma2 family endonuclease [Algoriphagus sp. TR-M9]
MESDEKDLVKEPFTEYGVYSYADYLTWDIDEMVELIKGKVFRSAAAAPRMKHQQIVLRLGSAFLQFLENKPCEAFIAPFDVRLPVKSRKNEDIFTVVQPDICVVCDRSKLDDAGCLGAPDLIVEVLSPGNNKKELKNKYEVYEESGVREYWVIHPSEETLMIYSLIDGKYNPSRLFTRGDIVKSECIAGFELDLEKFFEKID